MDPKVRNNLQALGFTPDDYENCPEFALLEDWFLNFDEGNILSEDEVEVLDLASFIEPNDVLKTLKENGLDEDLWETHESDIEYLQNKLRQMETRSNNLDQLIDTLRNEKNHSMRIEKELNEKMEAVRSNSLATECGEKWDQIQSELQQILEEFEKLNSVYDDNNYAEDFQEFLNLFKKELDVFISNVNQYVDGSWSWVKTDKSQEKHENLCNESNQPHGIEISQISNLEQRLTCSNYNNIFQNIKIGGSKENLKMLTQLFPLNKLSNFPAKNIDLKNWESICNDILNLSVKQAQLQIKEEGTLHHLNSVKALRESWIESSENLLQILEKQQGLLELVSFVWFLWKKGNSDIQEGLDYFYQLFQQEIANRSARIASLEDSKKKFELYLNETLKKENPYQQMLEKIPRQYFSSKEQNLPDLITLLKDNLQTTVCQQSISIENSKNQLAIMDKKIDGIQESVNGSLEILSEIKNGFNTANYVIEVHKERRKDILTKIVPDLSKNIQRLLWVKFLTDSKNLKEQLEGITELPTSPTFTNNIIFTSTPMRDE